MGALPWVRFVHLLAASVWTGGLIVLAALVVALRREGATVELLRAAARQFARISWVAMALAVVTGLGQVHLLQMSWSYGRLHLKLALVALVIVVALVHQFTARACSPALRGLFQLVILIASLAIFAVAVHL